MGISSILGVIVLYETDFEESKTFKTIQQSLSYLSDSFEVLLYDNSSLAQYDDKYFEIGNVKVHYIHDSSNPGIGKAYNTGAILAQKLNKDWLLLLDQDTEFPETILRSYLSEIDNNPKIELFAPILHLSDGTIFSPCNYIFKRGFIKTEVKLGLNSLKYSSPVNSGMLISLNAFLNAGGYNEKIQLDFSDFQFIEKFKKVHNKFFLLNEICIQDFSNDVSDIDNLEKRFKIYCNDAKNCKSFNITDQFFYFSNSLLRAFKLSIRTKRIRFLLIWARNFIGSNIRSKKIEY